jgi:hypothetical protein
VLVTPTIYSLISQAIHPLSEHYTESSEGVDVEDLSALSKLMSRASWRVMAPELVTLKASFASSFHASRMAFKNDRVASPV